MTLRSMLLATALAFVLSPAVAGSALKAIETDKDGTIDAKELGGRDGQALLRLLR